MWIMLGCQTMQTDHENLIWSAEDGCREIFWDVVIVLEGVWFFMSLNINVGYSAYIVIDVLYIHIHMLNALMCNHVGMPDDADWPWKSHLVGWIWLQRGDEAFWDAVIVLEGVSLLSRSLSVSLSLSLSLSVSLSKATFPVCMHGRKEVARGAHNCGGVKLWP